MVPRTGRHPLPSFRTKAFTACNITQKDGVWWTYRSNKSKHDKFEWRNKNMCLPVNQKYLWCKTITLFTIEEVFNYTRNLEIRDNNKNIYTWWEWWDRGITERFAVKMVYLDFLRWKTLVGFKAVLTLLMASSKFSSSSGTSFSFLRIP